MQPTTSPAPDRIDVPVSTLVLLDRAVMLADGPVIEQIARRADATDAMVATDAQTAISAATYSHDVGRLLRSNAILTGCLRGLLNGARAVGADLDTNAALTPEQDARLAQMVRDFHAAR